MNEEGEEEVEREKSLRMIGTILSDESMSNKKSME